MILREVSSVSLKILNFLGTSNILSNLWYIYIYRSQRLLFTREWMETFLSIKFLNTVLFNVHHPSHQTQNVVQAKGAGKKTEHPTTRFIKVSKPNKCCRNGHYITNPKKPLLWKNHHITVCIVCFAPKWVVWCYHPYPEGHKLTWNMKHPSVFRASQPPWRQYLCWKAILGDSQLFICLNLNMI